VPRHDPYLEDRNVRTAAGMQLVAGLFLGVLGGWAIAGWFDLNTTAGAVIGGIVMFLVANFLIYRYGGRATR
jgi:small neutral amino acid transporter SnatA (MarC family)